MDPHPTDRVEATVRPEVVQELVTLWQDERHTAIPRDVALLFDGERFPMLISRAHADARPSSAGVPEDELTGSRPTTAQIRSHLVGWAEGYVGASQGRRRIEAQRWVELLASCSDAELERAYRPAGI